MSQIRNRRLPHSLDVEASILGGILIRNDALAVVPTLEIDDFYDLKHRVVFEAIRNMEAARVPIDVVTVENELEKAGKLDAVGGIAFLGELALRVPTIDNIESYAKIVQDHRLTRDVILMLGEMTERALEGEYASEELVHEVSARLMRVKMAKERPVITMGELLREEADRVCADLDKKGSGERVFSGVPTGFVAIDERCGGSQVGVSQLYIARPGTGKAQPHSEPVMTPTGWRPLGDLVVGDRVIGSSGRPIAVTGVFERGELDCYRVVTDDGGETLCSGDHLWTTRTRADRRSGAPGSVRTTDEILRTMNRSDGGMNHSIGIVGAIRFDPVGDLPLDPYVLGLLIGDGCLVGQGCVKLSNPEIDIRARFVEALPVDDQAVVQDDLTIRVKRRVKNNEPSETEKALRRLGLSGVGSHERFIPLAYQRTSVDQRIRLLRGILDSDGYVSGQRTIELVTTSPTLAADVAELVGGLGGISSWVDKDAHYTTDGGDRVSARPVKRGWIRFPTGDVVPVSSSKHLAKWRPGASRLTARYIAIVEDAGRRACRCISVAADDGLYVTRSFLLTHNTTFAMALMKAAKEIADMDSLLASFEDAGKSFGQRALAQESGVPTERLRARKISDRAEVAAIVSAKGARAEARSELFLDCNGMQVEELIRRVRRENLRRQSAGKKPIRQLIVDYIQKMPMPNWARSREEGVGHISMALSTFAATDDMAVVIMSQLNREVEKRDDHRPRLSDIRDSGSLEQDGKLIFGIYHPHKYEPDKYAATDVRLLVLKNAQGGSHGEIELYWDVERHAIYNSALDYQTARAMRGNRNGSDRW